MSLLLGRSRSGASVGGSAGAGSFHISFPCFVIKRQLAGSWWALLSPFRRQPSHTNSQPLLSHPPGVRGQPGHSGCSTLHLAVKWSLPRSVPNPGTFLTYPWSWLFPASGLFLQEDHLTLPTPLRSPLCDIPVTPMWLLAPGAL